MPKLPITQSDVVELVQMQTKWAGLLNPLLAQPSAQQLILTNVKLAVGQNVVAHTLGRKLRGWIPVRVRGTAAQLYDLQDANQHPELTLILNSSAAVTVDLVVF